MSFRDQDDLDIVRKQFEYNQTRRAEEAELLEIEHAMAVRKLKLVRKSLIEQKTYTINVRNGKSGEAVNDPVEDVEHTVFYNVDRKVTEMERDYQSALEWIWKLKRQNRELTREERDDLQWMWMLERRQREASEHHRPQVEQSTKRSEKRQQRATNWKTNRATNGEKPETSKN